MRELQEKRLRRILDAGSWTEEDMAWFIDSWERDAEGWMRGVLRESFDASIGNTFSEQHIDAEALLHRLHHRKERHSVRMMKSRWLTTLVAASLVLGFLGVAYLWQSGRKATLQQETIRLQGGLEDILPGTDRALLVLPGGRTLPLDSLKKGFLDVGEGYLNVQLQDEGIRYAASSDIPQSPDATILHTILTPRGGQYRLTLSDGTHIWLNATSSIQFPAVFPRGERRVSITGEAYLEVARDESRPFWVDVDGRALVKVVGTRFYINAYRDEPSLDISLIEGSVKVGRMADVQMVGINPSQQARLFEGGGPMVFDFDDVQRLVAWKDGKFQFGDGVELSVVLRQLERWYDVEFRYDVDVRGHVGGSISRDVPLSQVLELIGLTGVARFSREGRIVRVSKPR